MNKYNRAAILTACFLAGNMYCAEQQGDSGLQLRELAQFLNVIKIGHQTAEHQAKELGESNHPILQEFFQEITQPRNQEEIELYQDYAVIFQDLNLLTDRCEKHMAHLSKQQDDAESKGTQSLIADIYAWTKGYTMWIARSADLRKRRDKLDERDRARKWKAETLPIMQEQQVQFYVDQYSVPGAPIPSQPSHLQKLAIARLPK